MRCNKAEYSHIGGREENEDSVFCGIGDDQSVCAVVADGLGGHGDGQIASRIVVQTLAQGAQCTRLPGEEQLLGWFREANARILEENRSAAGMRSTAVFLAVFQQEALWAHIGDSRLYHFHNGQLRNYTLDHSVPQVQVLMGELTRDQIPGSPDRNRILRSVGNEEIEVEIAPAIPLEPGRHAFLLCTDGFWEYLSEAEIWLDLLKSGSPEAWLMYLRCRGEARKGADADNNTAAAIFVDV